VLAAVATSLWAIGAPALRALMPGLVPPEQLAASQALQGIYSDTGAIVGPAVGGLLIAAAGVGATYAIDTASFVPSLAAALLIAPAPPKDAVPERALESLREGFSLRFSIVSGGVACAVGTVAILAAIPSLLRYDSKNRVPEGHVTGTVPGTNG
jgi:MFS transporter, ENTS family, enterobactin (siderophore) exporter